MGSQPYRGKSTSSRKLRGTLCRLSDAEPYFRSLEVMQLFFLITCRFPRVSMRAGSSALCAAICGDFHPIVLHRFPFVTIGTNFEVLMAAGFEYLQNLKLLYYIVVYLL